MSLDFFFLFSLVVIFVVIWALNLISIYIELKWIITVDFKIEIKRTDEIAPRHRPKTEISARSAQFRPASVGKRGFERAWSAPFARDLTVAVDAGEVLVRSATRLELAELGRRAVRLHALIAVLTRGATWLVDFGVSCSVRRNLNLKVLIGWFWCSVFCSVNFKVIS